LVAAAPGPDAANADADARFSTSKGDVQMCGDG
jgi:hypothetical protein